MKKIITIVAVIAVVTGAIGYATEENSSKNDEYIPYKTYYGGLSYYDVPYYSNYTPANYNCIFCNNTGKVSCSHCYGQGETSYKPYIYGEGYGATQYKDCAYCVGGKTDCTLC